MDAWTSFVSIKGEEPINVHQLTQYSLNNNECKTLTYDEAKKIFDLNSTKKKSNKKRNSMKKRHRRKRKSKIKNNIQSKSQSPTLNSTVYSRENSFSDMTDMTLNSIISGVTTVTNITNITSLTNMTHDKVAIERNTSADYYTNNNNNNNNINTNIENNNNDNNNINSNNNDNNINNNNVSNGNSNNNSRKSIHHNDDTQLKNKNNDDRKEFYQSIQLRKRTYDNIKDKRRYNPGLNPSTPTPIIRRISRLVNDDVSYRYNNDYAKKISLHDDDDEYSDSTLPRYNRYNSVPYVSSKTKKKANKRGTGNALINLVTPAADDFSDSDLSLVKAKLKKSGKSQPNKKNMKSKSSGAGSVGSSNGRRRHRSVSHLSSKHNSHALNKKNVIQLNSLTAIDDKNLSTTDEDRDQFDAKMVVIDDHFKKGAKFPKSITKTQSDMYITFGLNDKGKRGHKKKHKKPSHKGSKSFSLSSSWANNPLQYISNKLGFGAATKKGIKKGNAVHDSSNKGYVFGIEYNYCQHHFIMKYESPIPMILYLLKTKLFEKNGHLIEGIFRINGNNKEQKTLKADLDKCQDLKTFEFNNASSANIAGLVKIWLREMPVNVLQNVDLNVIESVNTDFNLDEILDSIDEPFQSIFLWILDLCIDVSKYENKNKMNHKNMAIVIAPNLFDVMKLDISKALSISDCLVAFLSKCIKLRIKQLNTHL